MSMWKENCTTVCMCNHKTQHLNKNVYEEQQQQQQAYDYSGAYPSYSAARTYFQFC